MPTSLRLAGWALVMPLVGLGCESMARNNCCAPCPCAPITSTCAAKFGCSGCMATTCCGESGSSILDRIAKATRRTNDCCCCCRTSSAIVSPVSCGRPVVAPAAPVPVPTTSPEPIKAPAKTTLRSKFDPFAITDNMQMPCGPCKTCSPAAAMPMPSVATTAQHRPRAALPPVAAAEIVQQAVVTQPVVARKMPVTPSVSFHSDDYTSLVGQLEYNAHTDKWRVRYATADVSDVFGGSVTLIDVGDMMQGLRSGQMVAVKGEVFDLETASVSPTYKVRQIGLVNP